MRAAVATLVLVALLPILGARCAHIPSAIDPSQAAPAANDATAIVSGCGSQPIVGYLYCRKREGEASDVERVTFHGPRANCKADACVIITVYAQDGTVRLTAEIPKGKDSVGVRWRDILGRDRFDRGDRGFWPFLVETKWTDADGDERTTLQEGEIRLRVTTAGYVPLHDTAHSPHWGWEYYDAQAQRRFRYTTAGRAYVGNR